MSLRDWIRNFFTPKFRGIVFELPEELKQLPEKVDPETMAALSVHPGFRNLLYKLKVNKAVLESRLRTEAHKDLAEVLRLQAHIQAVRWLERQMLEGIKAPIKAKEVDVVDELQKAYEHSFQIVEAVGTEKI